MTILKNTLKRCICTVFVLYSSLFFITAAFSQETDGKQKELPAHLKGVTIDDAWYDTVNVKTVIAALKSMKTKPVVRIVMSKNEPLATYKTLFKEVHKVAYIMACPVDSYEMKLYKTVKSYKKRFETVYAELSDYIDMWEIGNEINGEDWLGKNPSFIAQKMTAAYDFIRSKNGVTVLTAYLTAPGMQKTDMHSWLKTYVPKHIKEQLDYLLVSYYEDDNEGFQPDWHSVFKKLNLLFPSSKLGIGECGNVADGADENSKSAMIRRYYSMPAYTKNYVGGYFWWYWVQDCVPHTNNRLWKLIDEL